MIKEDLVGPDNKVQMNMRDPYLGKISPEDTGKISSEERPSISEGFEEVLLTMGQW